MSNGLSRLDIVIFGLSITSAWGNGHATTYRALVRALAERGHRITFYERDCAWYADHRDMRAPPWCTTRLYNGLDELESHFRHEIPADLVIVGSYVPEGAALAEWVLSRARGLTAFYDIDTPVTVAALERGECEYLTPSLVPRFDLYLSFSGGPVLDRLHTVHGASRVRALYCSVDTKLYFPMQLTPQYDVAYLGTYSPDRQPKLELLLNDAARQWIQGRFCVAGAQYPRFIEWPPNVQRVEHLPPQEHCRFYNRQRFALNVTRADMVASGYSPSVRLFEAAACGVPIITDEWPGLESFFQPDRDILIARSASDTLRHLRNMDPLHARGIGALGRSRVLAAHTSAHRAMQLESYVGEIRTAPVMKPKVFAAREAVHGS